MEGEGVVETIERYLEDLAFQMNRIRLKSMFCDTRDNILIRMDNALLFAYNAWYYNGDSARALGHLEIVQDTCVERLTAVFRAKYSTCVTLLRGELLREPTPEPEHQDAHIAELLQLLK